MPDVSPSDPSRSNDTNSDLKQNSSEEWRQAHLPPIFALGEVVATANALAVLLDKGIDVFDLLARHGRGDWGEIDEEDMEANNQALEHGTRLLSAYELPDCESKVWVITEADRSATTVLLPEEY